MPTKIEYCDETLEVTGGCTKCSPGCTNCWAIPEVWRMAHNPIMGDKWQGLVEKKNGVLNWTGKIKCFDDALQIPLKRKKPTTYFIDSKADLFHIGVPFNHIITRLHDRIDVCQQHTFLIFTKRVERAKEYYLDFLGGRVPENIQLMLSISTQAEADEKIPIFLQIPGFHGLSIEPMLEGIDLAGTDKSKMGKTGYLANYFTPFFCNDCGRHLSRPPTQVTQLCRYCGSMSSKRGNSIDRVIVGGESGPGARPMHPDWPRGIRDQCAANNVPFYFKQWGEWEIANKENATRNGYIVTESRQGFLTPYNKKKFISLNFDGSYYRDNPQPNSVAMVRVGKKKAGYLLDGKIWKQLPK